MGSGLFSVEKLYETWDNEGWSLEILIQYGEIFFIGIIAKNTP